MPKEIKYESLLQRDLAERDTRDVLARLVAILEDRDPGLYAEGGNKLFPPKEGEEHRLSYTKPQ
jgi:hypothetical protein